MGSKTLKRAGAAAILITFVVLGLAPPVEANIIRGIMYIVGGIIEIPRATLVGTMHGPPILGTAFGALSGSVNAVGYTVRGLLDLASSVVPIAKSVAPFIPLFF